LKGADPAVTRHISDQLRFLQAPPTTMFCGCRVDIIGVILYTPAMTADDTNGGSSDGLVRAVFRR